MPIDPFNIINYDRTDAELERFLLFCIAVAGKNAVTTDRAFERLWNLLLGKYGSEGTFTLSPFEVLTEAFNERFLGPYALRDCGFGCYNHRYKSFRAAVTSGLDLRTCSIDDLEKIPGIGRKTNRFFMLSTRQGFRAAALDTHLLKHLADIGIQNTPKSTPTSKKEYNRLENIFLAYLDELNFVRAHHGHKPLSAAELDLDIWTSYTKNKPNENSRSK